jgi:hypothetical protein
MTPQALFKSLSKRHSTPEKVQRYLRELKYNSEKDGETVRSALEVYRHQMAHCLEGAILAAAILEQQGFTPQILSFDSSDRIGHSIFIFKAKTGWGSVARSKIPGLHGREPRFRSLRDLTWSYVEPFVDATGSLTAYLPLQLDESGTDWRYSPRNCRKLETFIVNSKHHRIYPSKTKFKILRKNFLERGPIQTGKYWW